MHLPGERDNRPRGDRAAGAFIAFDILRDGTRIPRPAAHPRRARARTHLRRARDRRSLRTANRSPATAAPLRARARTRAGKGSSPSAPTRATRAARRTPGVAQAEDRERAGVGRRRLDRAAADRASTSARWCSASTRRAADARLRRPRRQRLHRTRADAHRQDAARVRDRAPPFDGAVRPTRVHWIEPRLVAEVTFTGLDQRAATCATRVPRAARRRRARAASRWLGRVPASKAGRRARRRSAPCRCGAACRRARPATKASWRRRRQAAAASGPFGIPTTPEFDALIAKLQAMEDAKKDGVSRCRAARRSRSPTCARCSGRPKLTKGDLLRYYVRVAPLHPAGGRRSAAGDEALPERRHAARRSTSSARPTRCRPASASRHVADEGADTSAAAHRRRPEDAALHGAARGDLAGSVVLARRSTPHVADYVALDLDPMPRRAVRAGARRRALGPRRARTPRRPRRAEDVGLVDGLHVYIPLPRARPTKPAVLLCEILATIVAHKHRKEATVERTVGKRGRTVYVDYLQNILGKTLATAYSAAGQRVRRRVDAADLGRSRRGRQPRRLHHQDRAGALRRDARPVAAGHRRPAGRSARRPRAHGARFRTGDLSRAASQRQSWAQLSSR